MARKTLNGNLTPIVVLGEADKKDRVQAVEGVFRGRRPSTKYPGSYLFDLEQADGSLLSVAGNAVLKDRLTEELVGRYVWLEYLGQGTTKAGKPFARVQVDYDDGGDAAELDFVGTPAGDTPPLPDALPPDDESPF